MSQIVDVQHVSDETGQTIGAIEPIQLWQEIMSERETAYLLKSKNMKKRLLEAKQRQEGISLEATREKLGV